MSYSVCDKILRLTSWPELSYGRPARMRSARSSLIPGRVVSWSFVALFKSRGLSRPQPSRTPSATALAFSFSWAVASAVLSRRSSGVCFCVVHPASATVRTPASKTCRLRTRLRCRENRQSWFPLAAVRNRYCYCFFLPNSPPNPLTMELAGFCWPCPSPLRFPS